MKPADYDAVYVAGGRGPEYIRIDKRVQEIIRHFHKTDKPIFTICHGVQVLMAVPETIRGKEVAALEYCEPEVTAVGGKYIDVPPTGAHVDGKLVSAKGWPGLAAFMKNCLQVLGTEIRHAEPGAEGEGGLGDARLPLPLVGRGWGRASPRLGARHFRPTLRSTPLTQTLSPQGGEVPVSIPARPLARSEAKSACELLDILAVCVRCHERDCELRPRRSRALLRSRRAAARSPACCWIMTRSASPKPGLRS